MRTLPSIDQVPPQADLLYNPLDPDFLADPYPCYRRLRDEDPLHHSPLGFWVVSRYHACADLLRRSDTSVAYDVLEDYVAPAQRPRTLKDLDVLLFMDPPDHTRLRRLVARTFTAQRVGELEAYLRAKVDAVLERLEDGDEVDFVGECAYPIPVDVICHILGVDRLHVDAVRRWSNALARGMDPEFTQDESTLTASEAAIADLDEFFRQEVAERRRHPRDDLMTGLAVRAQAGEANEAEVVRSCILLLVAGHETTANLLGNGLRALLAPEHRAQAEQLASTPSLVGSAVEELVRFDPPVQITKRVPMVDVEVEGRVVEARSMVVLLLGSANRDDRVFPDADAVRVDRADNPHLAFSTGAHHCLGARLARWESTTVLGQLAPMLPRLEVVAPETLSMKTGVVVRGVRALPIRRA